MSIFQVNTPAKPAAELLAEGFLAEANQQFESQVQSVYDAIQRFWYRNKDSEGNPALEGDEPSGIEILQAMGPAAAPAMAVAYARVVMLVTIEQQLGQSGLVDLSKASAPYDLEFNNDGSLKTWNLKS